MTITVFHGTAAALRAEIEQNGLRPLGGLVYFSRFRSVALEHAAINAAGAELAGLDPADGLVVAVELDERFILRHGLLETTVDVAISPDAIVALESVKPIAAETCGATRRAEFRVFAAHRSRVLRASDEDDPRLAHPLFAAAPF